MMKEQRRAPEAHALAGAYALDAMTPTERREFEAHLNVCVPCQIEVGELTATAAKLGVAVAEEPPARLKNAVLSEIRRTRQNHPVVGIDSGARRRARRARLTSAVAVLLLLVTGGFGAIALQSTNRAGQLESIVAVMAAEDAIQVTLVDDDGRPAARLVASDTRDRAVLFAGGLDAPSGGDVYALWLIADDTTRLAATFVRVDEGVLFDVDTDLRDVQALAITAEPDADVTAPTRKPVALAPL